MEGEGLTAREREEIFNKEIIGEYLKYGSVDEVFKRHGYDLPISIAGYYRLLDKWGVVRAAGPNNKLAEAIEFLEELALEKIPLERLYKRMPPSFKTSAVTLHRILSHIKKGVIRRAATALVISSERDPNRILVGRDVTAPRLEYGKYYGAFSVPMTFSKRNESKERSILRVLQQEVFSKQTVERNFPYEVIPDEPEPFVLLDVADVRLAVYHLALQGRQAEKEQFHSFKLVEYDYLDRAEIEERAGEFRVGVAELVKFYEKYKTAMQKGEVVNPKVEVSWLNRELVSELL